MKGFIRRGAVIAVAGMLLTGCGEELKVMTESEEAVIVNYAAGTVAKFNKRQQDGITAVAAEREEAAEQEKETEEQIKEEKPEKPEGSKDKPSKEEKEPEADKNLAQVLSLSDIEIKYTGYEVRDSYEESDYFSMKALEGKTYFVMKYTITNSGAKEKKCDILSKKPIFTVSLNGGSAVQNEVTLLPNDLSTYAETIAPGASAKAILIFEVPAEQTKKITSVQANVQADGRSGDAAK